MNDHDHRTGGTRTQAGAPLLEPLERRQLLDAQFASVGLFYELDPDGVLSAETFSTEGTITDAGGATGSMFQSDRAGRILDEGLEYNRVENLADGRFERSPDRGRLADPMETNGAQFIRTGGVGWWYAERRISDLAGGEFLQEIEYLVERPETAAISDLQGMWRFSLIGVDFDENEPFNGTGTLSISGGTVTWNVDFGSVARSTSAIESTGSMGQFISSEQEFFYLSADGQSLIFADMAERDGIVFTGVAVRTDATVSAERLAGGYLLTWAATGEAARDIRGDDIGFAQRFLDLRPDGEYRLYDLDAYDDGGRNPLGSGRWTLSGSSLTLDVSGTDELLNFVVSDGGQTILGTDWDDGEFVDPVVGLGVRAGGPLITDVELVTAGTTPAGSPAVYQLRRGGAWFVSDIVAESGSPAIVGDFAAWEDRRDGAVYAAGATAEGDVLLFVQSERGLWSFRNLSQELAVGGVAQRIVGDVELMISAQNMVNLVGLGADGDVVRFFDTGVARSISAGPGFSWGVMNITEEQLAPVGQVTPEFAGELVAYATPWGGLNIAGLDEVGRIWSVWWAPGAERWQSSNLSELYNAPMLAGGLTVYQTPWSGINIAGVDPEGELRVTWWVPQFVDTWFNSNLTEEVGGPRLSAESLASFVSSWGGLNVAGISTENGEVVNYWWSPERVEIGWAATSLTDAVTPAPPTPITGPLTGSAGPADALNVFAFNTEEELVRLFWMPAFGGEWEFQNVHELAVPTA